MCVCVVRGFEYRKYVVCVHVTRGFDLQKRITFIYVVMKGFDVQSVCLAHISIHLWFFFTYSRNDSLVFTVTSTYIFITQWLFY